MILFKARCHLKGRPNKETVHVVAVAMKGALETALAHPNVKTVYAVEAVTANALVLVEGAL